MQIAFLNVLGKFFRAAQVPRRSLPGGSSRILTVRSCRRLALESEQQDFRVPTGGPRSGIRPSRFDNAAARLYYGESRKRRLAQGR